MSVNFGALERIIGLLEKILQVQERSADTQGRTALLLEELIQRQRETGTGIRALEGSLQDVGTRVGRLEGRTDELLRRLDEFSAEVWRLRLAQEDLARRLGPQLEAALGAALLKLLESKGLEVVDPPAPLATDRVEVDLAVLAREPSATELWVLADVRGRIGPPDVREAAAKFSNPEVVESLRAAGIKGPCLVYLGGLAVYRGLEREASAHGIGLFDQFGERSPAKLRTL